MKYITINYDPFGGWQRGPVRLTIYLDGKVVVESINSLPFPDVATRKVTGLEWDYRYCEVLPATEKLKEIYDQLRQIDFPALFSEKQEYKDTRLCGSSLEICWHYSYHGVYLTLPKLSCCQSKEAVRLHELMKSLFAEMNMEEWYGH
jgi:hypothetical protein